MNSNEVPILDLVARLKLAWEAGSPEMFALCLSEDGEWTDVLGNLAVGRRAVRDMHVMPFTKLFVNASFTSWESRVRMVSSDVAQVDVTWQSEGQTMPDGVTPVGPRRGLLTIVARFEAGKWEVWSGHNTDYSHAYRRTLEGGNPLQS